MRLNNIVFEIKMSIRKRLLIKRDAGREILQKKNYTSEDTENIGIDIERLVEAKTGSCQHVPGIGTRCFSP